MLELRRLAGRVGRVFWNDKVAAAHTVFYLISAAIFLPLVAGMFIFMQDAADGPVDPARGLDSRARAGLAQITNNPGKAQGLATSYWENLGDGLAVDEIGLRDENETKQLSYAKIANLQRGGLIKNTGDPFLNYPEFKEALRFDSDLNFHLRLSPVILNPSGDPYGAKPLAGKHVAYVANVTSANVDMTSKQFTDVSATGTAEIAALKALGLQTDAGNVDNGFDGSFYQPINLNTGVNTGNVYLNSNVAEGDVIADTDRLYGPLSFNPADASPYHYWFWNNYLKDGVGKYRYDAIVFGGNVNLDRWDTDGDKLQDFVEAGGVVIFMGSKNLQDDFVTKCTTPANCLFYPTGTQQAPTTPDYTNQMLMVPNRISLATYDLYGANTWEVCATSTIVNERSGFIPIDIDTPVPADCMDARFGATTTDRYGSTGGTVILTQWDLTAEPLRNSAKLFSNLLSFGLLRPVYLDYGPEIPQDAPVVTAERLMLVQFPDGDYMDVKIVFYLWRGACGPVVNLC